MTATQSTTRAALIAAAADLIGDRPVLDWADDAYVEGMCALIAEACGVEDPTNRRSEVWAEIQAAQAAAALAQRADKIAAEVFAHHVPQFGDPTDEDIRSALTAAVLAGMEAAK